MKKQPIHPVRTLVGLRFEDGVDQMLAWFQNQLVRHVRGQQENITQIFRSPVSFAPFMSVPVPSRIVVT
jgi:hypothetical protein